MLGSHLVLVRLYRGLQLEITKTMRIGDIEYPIQCSVVNQVAEHLIGNVSYLCGVAGLAYHDVLRVSFWHSLSSGRLTLYCYSSLELELRKSTQRRIEFTS